MALHGRRLTIGLLAGVVVVLIVGSGAAVAISRHQHGTDTAAAATVTTTASKSAQRTGSAAATSGSGRAPAGTKASASASRSAPQSVAATGDPSVASLGPSNNMTVQVSPGVRANVRSAPIQQLLQDYFDAINQHNYHTWIQLVSPAMAGRQNSAQWLDAYATTVDSSIWILSMTDDPVQVKLRFTSQQDPDLAPKDLPVDCINWTLTFQFSSEGGRMVVGSTVPGSVTTAKCA